ncbi:hypothetical protein COO60DRAFT_1477260 [Scenedesmus sp. NREL 46B-D3]|nr:hypothetical protein COO60DRAFT_1477260 [Scenedesmus sp. NREL 46B-D3]
MQGHSTCAPAWQCSALLGLSDSASLLGAAKLQHCHRLNCWQVVGHNCLDNMPSLRSARRHLPELSGQHGARTTAARDAQQTYTLLTSRAGQRCLLSACLTGRHWRSVLLLGPSCLLCRGAVATEWQQQLLGHHPASRHCCHIQRRSRTCGCLA